MLHSLKPVKNTTNLTANLTEASMLNPITSTKNKTNLMEASMLNTLKTNLILTRAVLIALFAGLFILAACGGGGGAAAPTTPAGPGTNICDANPFGPTCTRDVDATARATAITDCATSIDTKANQRDCAIVPNAVLYCLVDSLDSTSGATACDATAYDTARQGSGVTLATLTSNRLTLCRDGSNRNDLTLCTSAVVQNCGDDANPFDLLCGRLNPARNAIIEKCVDSATLADPMKNADCVAARTAGFTCFDNPWADSCLTSTMYREFASFRDDAQTSRLAYCLGDDADVGVCGSALAQVCVDSGAGANPFDDLCTTTGNAFDSVRADFATNCFNDENNGADCTVTAFEMARTGDAALCDGVAGELATNPNDPTCMTTPVTVASCSSAPFSTDCRGVDTFAGARTALFGICTNGVVDDKDSFCDADGNNNGGFTADEITCLENPFTTGGSVDCGMLFTALGGTVADAQNTLITACTTGADADMNENCNAGDMTGAVAVCLDNPFSANCDTILGSETQATMAQDNLISLCTGAGADGMNAVCTTLAGTTACIANPFDAACDMALGSETQAETAQNNLIALCTGADADGMNTLCTTLAGTTACIANPFDAACDMALGSETQATMAQNNLIALCTGTDASVATNTLCTGLPAGATKDCITNPFGSACETTLGANAQTTAQANLIEICSGDGADGTNARCTIGGIASALTGCLRDPFINGCDTTLGATQATTAQSNILTLCTAEGSDSFRTNTLCTDIARDGSENTGNLRVEACLDNPFLETHTGVTCEITLGGADARARAQANLSRVCFSDTPDTTFCTPELKTSQFCSATAAGADPFHAYCEDVANIDAADTGVRALFCDEPANASDARCATQTTCVANPFASDCLADGNIYADNRDRAIAACEGVAEVDRDTSPLCMGVEIKAEIPAVPGGAALVPAVNLAHCFANPFLADCADGAFDDTRTASFDACEGVAEGSRGTAPACMGLIIKAAVTDGQNDADAVTVASCIADPFSADCTNDVFDDIRMASYTACNGDNTRADAACLHVIVAADVANSVTLVNVATCTDNPFVSGCDTLEAFALSRSLLFGQCIQAGVVDVATSKTDTSATDTGCLTPIGSTTVAGCNTDPFHADCVSFEVFADARCTAQPFNTECLGNDVYDTARCTANPFYMDCAMDTSLDSARDAICMATTTSSIFNVNCTEDDYTGTDAARKTFADECRDDPTGTGCDTAVSDATGAPTIAMCNTNPYATGCDATVFADALTAYCADDADTIFNANCDSRDNIDTARSVVIGECVAALTTNKNDASCTGRVIVAGVAEDTVAGTPAIPAVTVGVCLDDPFNTSCDSDLFQFARDDHMEVCMSNGNAKLPSCTNINTGDTTYQTCLRNPFDTACMSSTSGHRYRNARAARYAFCEGSRAGDEGGTGGLCAGEGSGGTGTTIRGEICSYDGVVAIGDRLNPFAGVCGDDNADAQIDYCGVGDNSKTQDSCTDSTFNTTVAAGCLDNPFSTACTTATTDAIDADVRTRITTKRVAYCREAAGEDFDATLCNLDAAVGVENEICASQGANGDPFSGLCTLDDADFATERAAFVQACDALVKADSSATALAGGATCTASIIACNADAYGTDCVDEAAYSSVRQVVIADCESDTPTNSLCTSNANIVACLANPYLIRAAVAETAPGADDAVAGLNCAGNADYSVVRTTLEDTTCVEGGAGDAARCPILVANVCGEGTDVGSNPFNSDYCFAPSNTFDVQRKTLVDGCVGVTTATDACTQEIIDCIANPFATSGITTRTSTVACDAASITAAFDAPKVTYCGTGMTGVTANISQEKCQIFADVLGNECVQNPFGEFEAGTPCADTHIGGGDITAARTLRTTYCSGLGTTSAAIRADTSGSTPSATICLGAVENFCTGDDLFASATGAGVFDCLTDAEYNTPRDTQYQLCNGDMASRAGMDCDSTAVAICTNATIAEADPFAPICTETSTLNAGNVMTARQAVVAECAPLDTNGRNGNPRCGRSVTDSTPNNSVTEILATCDADPREGACDDYASTGHFNTERLARYASDCAGVSPHATLCPVAPVQIAICTNSGSNARPFAAICTSGTPVANIQSIRLGVLNTCLTSGDTDGLCAVGDGFAGASITSAAAQCGSGAAGANPFNPTAVITGFTAIVDCETIDKYLTIRNTFRNSCRDALPATTDYTSTNCAEVITDICTATTGTNANPFSNICSATTHSGQRATFATSCVGATAPLGNGATCPAAVIECANNPFGSTCVLTGTTTVDPAYNAQRTAVLTLCDSAEKIVANVGGRCDDAVDDVRCLKDPINCSGTVSEFTEATVGPGTYLITLRQNRYEYCNIRDNINAQPAICRTSATPQSFCIRNPFDPGCTVTTTGPRLGNDLAKYRRDRLAYCRTLSGADANRYPSNNGGGVGAAHTGNAANSINLCNVADRTEDAAGIICGDRHETTTAVTAGLGLTRDPFIDFCSELTEYNSARMTRITDCAGFSDPGATGTTVCNWARQVNLCANTDTALNAQCGTLNDLTKWKDGSTGDYDPVELTNLGAGDANEFVTDITLDTTFEYLTLAATPAVSSTLVGAAISYGSTFPSVTVFSARKKQVLYSCSADNDNTLNPSCSTGTDGITLTGGEKATVGTEKTPVGEQRFYARINAGNVGRPVFNRVDSPTATWNGRIQWIGNGTFAGGTDRSNFQMKVDFAARTIQGAASIAETNVPGTGNHLVIDGTYTGAGIISGSTSLRDYTANPNLDSNAINIGATINGSASEPGFVSGIIGHLGAVGAFISSTDSNANGYAGGFIVCSAVTNATCRP